MIRILRTTAENKDFKELVRALDADLALRDGADHAFYAQFNKINVIPYAVVVYDEQTPVGCGAIKPYGDKAMEIKRMYTVPEYRGQGIASRVLAELEQWAAELSCEKCLLETGLRQPEAIALYTRKGYTPTPNYGQYRGVENSCCFEKTLKRIPGTLKGQ